MADSDSDLDLSGAFARLQAGDPAARNELVSRLYNRITRLTAVLLRSFPVVHRRREIDSVANDLSIKLMRALDDGVRTGNVGDFFRFAAAKLRHLLIDEANKYRRRATLAENLPRGNAVSPLAGNDSSADLDPGTWSLDPGTLAQWTEFHDRVSGLDKEEREVFELHFFLQMPQSEIATVLKMEPKQVSRKWLKACTALADYVPGAG